MGEKETNEGKSENGDDINESTRRRKMEEEKER